MNNLGKSLIETFLEENDIPNIKKIIGLFPGRFQTFGPHHLATYNWLKKQFPDSYITTSNIQGYPRNPLSFKEKQQHISKMGVQKNHIVMETSPYIAENLLKKFDPHTTAVVYIFGEKDAGRLTGGKRKDDKPSYYQDYKKNKNNLKGFGEHSYILTAPHVSIKVGGKEVSGTVIRELLGSDKFDDNERQKLFKQAFGYFDPKTYKMMRDRFKKIFESVYTNERSLLIENPDTMELDNMNLGPWEDQAYAFGWYAGDVWINNSDTHFNLNPNGKYVERRNFAFPGRLWAKDKIISFWKYPTQAQFKKLVTQLNKKSKEKKYGWKIDNSWQVEVVLDKNGYWVKKITQFQGKTAYNGWYNHDLDAGFKNVLVPINSYAGSVERSEKEMCKTHLLYPLLKRINKQKLSAIDKARVKKGHVTAKQKALATKYKFSEEILIENPDKVIFKSKFNDFRDWNAAPFGFYKGKWYLGTAGSAHDQMRVDDKSNNANRDDFAMPGRLWWGPKIVTFWEYPTPAQFKKFVTNINALAKEQKKPFKIDNSWNIEVVADPKGNWARRIKDGTGDDTGKWWGDMFTGLADGYNTAIIPISMYNGSGPRSKSEKGQAHMLSPLLKKLDKQKLSAIDKSRAKKGRLDAKGKAMRTKYKFSEQKLNENPDHVDIESFFHDDELWFDEPNAWPFGFYGGETYIGPESKTHVDIKVPKGRGLDGYMHMQRKKYAFPGRLWAGGKIISFWKYPSAGQFRKIIKDLNKYAKDNKLGFQIDNSWQVEVVTDRQGKWAKNIKVSDWGLECYTTDWNPQYLANGYKNAIIPISDYVGSIDRSASEQGKAHMISPLLKKANKEKLRAIMAARAKKGHLSAKEKALVTKYKFSENELNEGRVFKSAGIVPYIRKGGEIYYLLLHSGRLWGFPKGMLDKGEDSIKAAKRETREETGISISKIDSGWKETQKFFVQVDYVTGEKLDKPAPKFVVYYLEESPTENVKLSFEHTKFKWAKYDEALKMLNFGKEILKSANDYLIKNEIIEKFKVNDDIIEKFIVERDVAKIIKEGTDTRLAPTDDGPPIFYKTFSEYKRTSKQWLDSMFEETGWKVINYILSHAAEDPENDFTMNYTTVPAVAYGKTGDGDGYPDPIDKYKKHIKKINRELGWEIVKWMGIDGKKTTGVDVEAPVPAGADKDVGNTDRMGKDKKMHESTFTKDWWTSELENANLIQEGGPAGNMAHPFDNNNLTFGDLKKIIELGLGGQLNREDNVSEKLDGQNLMLSWKNGKLIAARNKGHLKNAGKTALDMKGMAAKFKGRGEIYKAFVYAMGDLEKAVGKLSDKQRNKIFDEGKNFMNLEVMWPGSANVIDYDLAQIVFHGALKYDNDGTPIGEVPGSAKMLAGMIKQVNQNVQKHYRIEQPRFLEVPKHQDFGKLKDKFSKRLDKLRNQFALGDKATLAMYHEEWWKSFIKKQAAKMKAKNIGGAFDGLVGRWGFFDKSYSIGQLKKDLENQPEFLAWALEFDKNYHDTQVKENMLPFETLFFEVGATILKNVSGYLAVNPDKSVQKMKDEFNKAVKEIEKGGDPNKLKKLHTQLKRLDAIGGMDAVVPTEGIVFKYNGQIYKFTGSFASINRVMGLLTF